MRTTIRYLSTLSALLVAGVVVHSTAVAQETRTLAAPTVAPAEQLEQMAYQPVQHDNWLPAANDLEQAARLRAPNDPKGVVDLISAATLLNSIHRSAAALPLLATAGKRAERMGNAELALQAYTGGLKVAEYLEDADQTEFFLARVEAVAILPGVTQAEKAAVVSGEEAANAW